ncbi:MAG: right-handed parallel beta-helix repeat-containing protein, partial [Caldilineaceae bacterium]
GATLTVAPGTVVKFKDSTGQLRVRGTLVADGAGGSPIVFTSLRDDTWGGDTDNDDGSMSPQAGDWKSIVFEDTSDDATNLLRNVLVQYGGGGEPMVQVVSSAPRLLDSALRMSGADALSIANQANPLVENTLLERNLGDGIDISTSSNPSLRNNRLVGNQQYAMRMTTSDRPDLSGNLAQGNRFNGMGLTGIVASNRELVVDLPYVITDLTVNPAVTLTVPAGFVGKMLGGANALVVNGTLLVLGNEPSPVVFTSIRDDSVGGDTNNDGVSSAPAPGDWGVIRVTTTGKLTLAYGQIRYGGNANQQDSQLHLVDNAQANLDHATLAYSLANGLHVESKTAGTTTRLTISASLFANNLLDGLKSSVT